MQNVNERKEEVFAFLEQDEASNEVKDFLKLKDKQAEGYARVLLDTVNAKVALHANFPGEVNKERDERIDQMAKATMLMAMLLGVPAKQMAGDLRWLEDKATEVMQRVNDAFPDLEGDLPVNIAS